ncbi:MAG: tyrosine-type recombinase/integrase [Archaeoglobus sp.]|nr:tyrosine-type recombinase/integrase [Archaeoglobus sp.]
MRGHIRKYKGRWAGVVELPRDPATGKRRQKWIYGDTKKEVEAKVNKLIHQIETGTYMEVTNMTVADYLREWLKNHRVNLSILTAEGYERYIEKHIIPEIGSIQLIKLNPMHIQGLYTKKLEVLSGKSVLQMHRILRKALNTALKSQIIPRNPADAVDPPKAEKYKIKVYDEEKFTELLNAVEGTDDEVPIVLAGGLGMRRGEVFGLRWSDVSFQKGTITVEQQLLPTKEGLIFKKPKTEDSIRTIEVPDYILSILKRHQKRQTENKLFFGPEYKDYNLVCCKPNGEPINPSTYSHIFARILKKHGLEHIRFHDLRHFNATIMLKYNVPVKVASKRLGHSTTAITQDIYQHVLTDMDKEAAEKLNNALFRSNNKSNTG